MDNSHEKAAEQHTLALIRASFSYVKKHKRKEYAILIGEGGRQRAGLYIYCVKTNNWRCCRTNKSGVGFESFYQFVHRVKNGVPIENRDWAWRSKKPQASTFYMCD